LFFGRRDKKRIATKKAIIDQKTNKVFGICSEMYKVVHYEDIIYLVEKSLESITEFGKLEIRPQTYMEGARFRMDLLYPDAKTHIKVGEDIIPKISLDSSLDLSTRLKGKLGLFMLKCTNGMGTWKSSITFARRHLQTLLLDDLVKSINSGFKMVDGQINMWKKWTEIPVNIDLYESLWETLPFSEAERKRIEVLPEMGTGLLLPTAIGNKNLDLWSLNSVLTQFSTHEVKSERRKIELETSVAKVMERVASSIQ
jgi:hypothetical protein